MRKYRLVLPESIAKEKARLAEIAKKKKQREAEKKREAKKRALEREKEKQKLKAKKERELEREKKKKEKEKKIRSEKLRKAREKRKLEKRKAKKLAEQQAYYEAHKEEVDAQKRQELKERMEKKRIQKEKKRAYHAMYNEAHKTPEQREKARIREEQKAAKKEAEKKAKKKKANAKYRKKVKRAKRLKEYMRKYYLEHAGKDTYQNHIEKNDVSGKFIIATAQDGSLKRKWCTKRWWNDVMKVWNEMIEKNHSEAMCPVDEICNSRKPVYKIHTELLLLKKINPEVEDNITVFRDEKGKIVKVKTNDEEWAIALKEPWYIEEKFIVNNMNPIKDKQTARWIGENLIEKNLSNDNFKKVILWNNYVLIDGDSDFDFCIGKTDHTAKNLYMSLFKKYGDTDYVFFIGNLDPTLYSKWTQKIKEKTGWESLFKRKYTYLSRKSVSKVDSSNDMPTKSNSTRSASGKSSAKR